MTFGSVIFLSLKPILCSAVVIAVLFLDSWFAVGSFWYYNNVLASVAKGVHCPYLAFFIQ